MQLDSIEVSGYRGYKSPFRVVIDESTTAIAGRNDAGKSTILEALELFLDDKAKPEPTDFTVGADLPLSITCQFSNLPDQVTLDVNFSTTLIDEYLLDSTKKLTVTKQWTPSKLTAAAVSVLALHPTASDGDLNLLGLKQNELKKKAQSLGLDDDTIEAEGDRRTNSAYRRAIWSKMLSAGEAALEERSVQLSSEEGLSVAKALSNYYPYFHLFRSDKASDESEPLAQDPVSLAVKQVIEQHSEQLDSLSREIEEQITGILTGVITKLAEVAPSLAASLRPKEIKPTWTSAYRKAQFVDENEVSLVKRGSGTRRLVLLSFFRAEAEKDISEEEPEAYHRGVITAVEEPETALHSDLQRQILSALLDVGDKPNRQVILTTHSSNLLRDVPATAIRFIAINEGERRCVLAESASAGRDLITELNKSLGIFTDHDVRCFVLVEGRRDKEGLMLLGDSLKRNNPDLSVSLRELEAQGRIAFMPLGGGGNLSLWESNLSPFHRHEIYMIDSDKADEKSEIKPEVRDLKSRANDRRHVFAWDRRELENYLTLDAVKGVYSDQAGFDVALDLRISAAGSWEYVDIPSLVAEVAHDCNSQTTTTWLDLSEERKREKESNAKKRLARAFDHDSVATAVWVDGCDLRDALLMIYSLATSDHADQETGHSPL